MSWSLCGHPKIGLMTYTARVLDCPLDSGWVGCGASLYGDWKIVHGVKSDESGQSVTNADQALS